MEGTTEELLAEYQATLYTLENCIGNTLARNCGYILAEIQAELDARGEGKNVANLGKESILAAVECEYCSNPATHQTRTRLSGVLGRLEDTCNFHHATKQDIREGGGNDHTNDSGQRRTGGVSGFEEGTG